MNHLLKIFGLRKYAEELGNKSIWLARGQAVQKWSKNSNNDEFISYYQNNDIVKFEKILKTNHSNVMDDSFLRERSKELL